MITREQWNALAYKLNEVWKCTDCGNVFLRQPKCDCQKLKHGEKCTCTFTRRTVAKRDEIPHLVTRQMFVALFGYLLFGVIVTFALPSSLFRLFKHLVARWWA